MKKSVLIIYILTHTLINACNSANYKNQSGIDTLENGILSLTKGIEYGKLGNLDSAYYYIGKSIEIFEKNNNTKYLASAYISFGILKKLNGRFDEAIQSYNKAEQVYKSSHNSPGLVYVYANKATIFERQQDYEKAELYHTESLNILNTDSMKNKLLIASIYNNLGILYKNTNQNKKAILCFLNSLKLKQEDKTIYSTYENLALSYEKEGNTDKAEFYYLKALENIHKNFGTNNIWYAQHQLNYGLFLQNSKNELSESLKNLEKALSIYKQILGIKNPETARAYSKIGEYYLKTGEYQKSLSYFQKSLISLSREFNDSGYSSNPELGTVSSKTQLLRSLKNKSIALEFTWEQDKTNINSLAASLAASELALDVIREIRSGFLSEQSKLFLAENEHETYIHTLETSYKIYEATRNKEYLEKAFRFSESGKSAVLSEAIQNNAALITGNVPLEIRNTENSLKKSIWTFEELIYEEGKKAEPDETFIVAWNKEIFTLKEKHAELIARIEKEYPDYFRLKFSNNSFEIKDIQERIKKKDAVIEYCLSTDNVYIFLITKTDYSLTCVKKEPGFDENLEMQINSLTDNNFSEHNLEDFNRFIKSSSYLYKQLILPVSGYINGKHLIIIPDGKLAYLPFETLLCHEGNYNTISYNKLHYLLFENPISYTYSPSILFDNEHNLKIAPKKLIAFAPKYDNQENQKPGVILTRQQYREKLYPLKGIKEEAKTVSKLIGGNLFLDENASEKTFKQQASEFDVLHLAMHTILNDESPMYSKMAFSQTSDTTEDGFLNTYEVYNLQLKSRMAVLSSCNSGSGILQKGEGVMSLARGFIYAGCPSLIMTLWSVEDNSGVKLMTVFYKDLKKGFSKSKSLQQAKIEFLQNADQLHAHPYFWSGYVVIGNNDALYTAMYIYIVFGVLFGAILVTLIVKKLNRSARIKKDDYPEPVE